MPLSSSAEDLRVYTASALSSGKGFVAVQIPVGWSKDHDDAPVTPGLASHRATVEALGVVGYW